MRTHPPATDDAPLASEPPSKRRKISRANDEASSLHSILLSAFFSDTDTLYKLVPMWASRRLYPVTARVSSEPASLVADVMSSTEETGNGSATKPPKKRRKSKPFNIETSTIIERENYIYEFLRHVLVRMKPTLAFVSTNVYLFEKRCFSFPLSWMSEECLNLVMSLYEHRDTVMDKRDYHGGLQIFSSAVRQTAVPSQIRKDICRCFHEYVRHLLLCHKSHRPKSIPKERARDFTVGVQMRAVAGAFGEYANLLGRLREEISKAPPESLGLYAADVEWIDPFLAALELDVSREGFSIQQCVAGMDVGTHNIRARMV